MSRHLMAKFRRQAEWDYWNDPHLPHDEWRERPTEMGSPNHYWHPSYGESHVRYNIVPRHLNGQKPDWVLYHSGFYQGLNKPSQVEDEDGQIVPTMAPNYVSNTDDSKIGYYEDLDRAKDAAEGHFRDNYGGASKPGADYYDHVLRHIDEPEDGYDIFGDRS